MDCNCLYTNPSMYPGTNLDLRGSSNPMTDHDVLYDAVHLSPSWYVAANTLCTYNYIPGTPGHPGTLDRLTGKVGKAFTEHPSMRQDMEGARCRWHWQA